MSNSSIHHSGTALVRPRARLIALLGNELISDEPVALVELVKNAYDADASYVTVTFEANVDGKIDRLIIADDGLGMDLDAVLHGWLEPGTLLKRTQSHSPAGRPYQGAKGIGRFAAARLAETLLLESKRRGTDDLLLVLLEWGRFEGDSYLDEIPVEFDVRKSLTASSGTKLFLENLRKPWVGGDFRQLHTRLSRLISPFDEVRDFTIFLSIPSHPDLSGEVQPPAFLLQPRYHLAGDVDSSGLFTGEIVTEGNTPLEYSAVQLNPKRVKPLCGPFGIEIRAWDRDREGLGPLAETLASTIQEVRSTLTDYSGVSIYRNGFRVHPYGQKGDDWLNLDIRSRQNPVMRLANNQIIGAIRISREDNPQLQDRSTREGLISNAANEDLRNWFKMVLALLEDARYKVRPRQKKDTFQEPLFEAFDLRPTLDEAKSALGPKHPVVRLFTKTERQVKVGVERVQEVLSRLLLSAGLGQMVDIVIHEIGAPLGKINRQLVLLEKQLLSLLGSPDVEKVTLMIANIKAWLAQIHGLRERLDPQVAGKRGRATTFDVSEEIQDNFDLYESVILKQRVAYTIEKPSEPVLVRMSRAALGQIIANLLDNSLYWLATSRGGASGGNILVQIRKERVGFTIVVSDDGPGVADQDRLAIFEPYFTKKANGIGLGLYISRLLMQYYGKLTYIDRGPLPGASFELVFDKKVGNDE